MVVHVDHGLADACQTATAEGVAYIKAFEDFVGESGGCGEELLVGHIGAEHLFAERYGQVDGHGLVAFVDCGDGVGHAEGREVEDGAADGL